MRDVLICRVSQQIEMKGSFGNGYLAHEDRLYVPGIERVDAIDY